MSRHVCLRCACGKIDFDGTSRFTRLVWAGTFGWLEEIGIDNPYQYLDDATVDGAAFQRWWEDALATMETRRDALPTLHRIWKVREDGEPFHTDAGYMRWRGTIYMVDDVYDRMIGVPLQPEVFEQRRHLVAYEPPEVDENEEFSPWDEPITPGELSVTAGQFQRIFQGLPLWLEHGNLVDFFADELREVTALARHAGEAGEKITIYFY